MAFGDTVFTISGPPEAQPCLGCSGEFGEPSEQDGRCAQQVAGGVVIGAGARITAIPAALFGAYKLLNKSPAAGITGFLAAGILWFAGGAVLQAATESFERCRVGGP